MVHVLDVSVIIPCYNSGEYISDAIDSVEGYQGKYTYEIIIINDGSTDEDSLRKLKELEQKEKYIVLHQENKGPAAARNTGCYHAKGKYLLFLDSDNKIEPEYIDVGIDILKRKPKIGIVYSDAYFFGDNSRNEFKTKPFDIDHLLLSNYIDMCAVVRKSAWASVNGFDESRSIIAHEDWDFWLKLYKMDWQFHYVNRKLFYYRIRESSLISTLRNSESISEKINLVKYKHRDLYIQRHRTLYENIRRHKNEYRIGHCIMKPYRLIKKMLRGRKLSNEFT